MPQSTLYDTLHIFESIDEVQVITPDGGNTKAFAQCPTLQSVIDNIWDNRPAGYAGTKEFHAINTFNGLFSDWQAKDLNQKGFRVQYDDLNGALIDALVLEVLAV